MKKSILAVLLLAGILVISCSKKDNNTPPDDKWYVGKWNVVEALNDKGQWIDATSLGWYANLSADGKYTSKQGRDNFTGTYVYDAKINTIICKVDDVTVTYKVKERSGNKATVDLGFNNSGEVLSLKIQKQ